VTDFGYSTLAAGESGIVFLPKSRPWNSPEHHFDEFNVLQAKKTDVYSFGMLCVWLLFEDSLLDIPHTSVDGALELISFNVPLGPLTLLERLKGDDKVTHIVNQLIELMSDLNTERRIRLKEFFSLTLQLDPQKRTSDVGKLVCLLSNQQCVLPETQLNPRAFAKKFRIKLQPHTATRMEETRELSMQADFRVSINLLHIS